MLVRMSSVAGGPALKREAVTWMAALDVPSLSSHALKWPLIAPLLDVTDPLSSVIAYQKKGV